MTDSVDAQRPRGFDDLFGPRYVRYADADVVGTLAPPDPALVHRVHLVAQPEPGVVLVCESHEGWCFLPGGRLEPGEDLHAAVRRELAEEAGAAPTVDAALFFSHVATSRRERPYLPHAPHPVSWWTYAVCEVEVTGPPTVPAGAEQIVRVHRLPVGEAVELLAGDRVDPAHADVVRLAVALGLVPAASTRSGSADGPS